MFSFVSSNFFIERHNCSWYGLGQRYLIVTSSIEKKVTFIVTRTKLYYVYNDYPIGKTARGGYGSLVFMLPKDVFLIIYASISC